MCHKSQWNESICEPGLDSCAVTYFFILIVLKLKIIIKTILIQVNKTNHKIGQCLSSSYCNKANFSSIWNDYKDNLSIPNADLLEVNCCNKDLCNGHSFINFSFIIKQKNHLVLFVMILLITFY